MSKRNRLKRALRRRLKRDHLRGDYSVPATLTRLEAQVLKETRKEALTILNKAPSFAEWTMKQGGPLEMLRHVAEKMSVPNRKSVEEMASSASSVESLNMLAPFGIPIIEDKNIPEGTIYAIYSSKMPEVAAINLEGLSQCASCRGLFFPKNDSDEIDSTSVCGECAEKGL